MRRILILLVAMILLAACSTPTPDPAVIDDLVAQTVEALPTQTPYPTYTPYPTVTKTPAPTKTPMPTPIPDTTGKAVAMNHIKEWTADGVTMELIRVLICDSSWSDVNSYSNLPAWRNANSYIMIEFKVKNNSNKKVSLMLIQHSLAAVNGEQVEANDYLWDFGYFNNKLDADLLPGIEIQDFYWLPLDTKFEDISTVYMDFVGAFVDGRGIINDMSIKLDISNWGFEERP